MLLYSLIKNKKYLLYHNLTNKFALKLKMCLPIYKVLKHKLFFKHPDKRIPIKSYFSKTSKKNFIKRILLKGRGYKTSFDKNSRFLILKIGFSHLVYLSIPLNVKIYKKKNKLVLKSSKLLTLNNFSIKIKKLKKVNFYKSKGLLFSTDNIKLKPVKKK
jgi:hypothetical protein